MRPVRSNRTPAILRHSFQRITANFVPYLYLLFCPADHASGHHATTLMASEYSVRERYRPRQPATHVTGCRTRAAVLDSALLAALATIAIEKIVLAVLRCIEERWQPGQEKADEGKQETYAYRLGHR
jgi:hypothetical protein